MNGRMIGRATVNKNEGADIVVMGKVIGKAKANIAEGDAIVSALFSPSVKYLPYGKTKLLCRLLKEQ